MTPVAAIGVVALLLFLPFIGRRDIVTSHEARVVQTARQMAAVGWPWNAQTVDVPPTELKTGGGNTRLESRLDAPPLAVNSWLVPVLNHRIRLEKPPLPYWCAATMFRLFGYGEGTARLPCAILGAVATLMIFDLGRRLLGSQTAGWIAAGVWLSSYFIVDEYRKSMADPYLAFFTLACVWAWVRAAPALVKAATAFPVILSEAKDLDATSDSPLSRSFGVPQDDRTTHAIWPMVIFYLSLALGVLAKGPVILPHVLVPIIAYHVCFGWRNFPRWIGHAIGLPLFVIVAAPWFAYVLNHVPHAMDMWRYESVGEFGENVENARPWWYYFPNLLLISLPWTPLLLFAYRGIDRGERRCLFPLLWYVAIVVFFSFANLKKNAYLLPLMPAPTLVIAYGCAGLFDDPHLREKRVALRNLVIGLAVAVFVVVNFVISTNENRRSPKPACETIDLELVYRPGVETLLTTNLPPEATVYLPLDIAQDPKAHSVLVLIDTRVKDTKLDDESMRQRVGRPVDFVEQLPVNGSLAGRWRLFRVVLVPAPR